MLKVAFAYSEVDQHSTTFTSSTHTSAHFVDISKTGRTNRVMTIVMQRLKYLRLACETSHTVLLLSLQLGNHNISTFSGGSG